VIGSAEREKQKLEVARQTEHEIFRILEKENIIQKADSIANDGNAFD